MTDEIEEYGQDVTVREADDGSVIVEQLDELLAAFDSDDDDAELKAHWFAQGYSDAEENPLQEVTNES